MIDEQRAARSCADADALVLVGEGARWVRMTAPIAVLVADTPSAVVDVIRDADAAARREACYAVGYVAYEAGAAFGLPSPYTSGALPLASFALYRPADVHPAILPPRGMLPYAVSAPAPSWEWPTYAAAFDRVKRHIADGDCYQANVTFELHADFSGDARGLFLELARSQRGRYAAYMRFGDHSICSASPELFFSRRATRLVTRPMKGTARRGRTPSEDRAAADRLRASAKERAENVMVVDMMRNDLGRIARTGTVDVPSLFSVERYPTIWQMTSEVTAESDAPLDEIFAALFPSASITGAPKVRAMEILGRLEERPRGIYTGAIGYIAPGGDAQFNVAIRTAFVDHRRNALTFGIGSGIVWDSQADSEYRECLLKGAVLDRSHTPFELLETMKWTPEDGYALLDNHIRRLRRSADYFGYPCDVNDVQRALAAAVMDSDRASRVRLLVDETGRVRTESVELGQDSPLVRACIATEPIDESDVFFFHKTTRRAAYEARRCPHCEDVILWNSRGEVTESTMANVVVELDGQRLTPPVASGLLAGTLRERLLQEGCLTERVLTRADLQRAARIWLINSVRGWREVTLQRHRDRPDDPAGREGEARERQVV